MAEQAREIPFCRACVFWDAYPVPGRGRCVKWDEITKSHEHCDKFKSRDEEKKGGA